MTRITAYKKSLLEEYVYAPFTTQEIAPPFAINKEHTCDNTLGRWPMMTSSFKRLNSVSLDLFYIRDVRQQWSSICFYIIM